MGLFRNNTPQTRFAPIWLAWLAIILLAASIFALRFPSVFHGTNFYAEDATEFVNRIYQEGYLSALGQPFNGYLVLVQYALAAVAVGIQQIFGLPLYVLPNIIAVLSCLMLGAIVALPFVLFRRELGVSLSLLVVLFGAFVPLHSSDYAVIGTIGNLKFAFLYAAFLLVLFRIHHPRERTKTYITDVLLLLCIFTNPATVLVMPFVLWPYRKELKTYIKDRKLSVMTGPFWTGLGVVLIGALYTAAAYIHGIPPMPGYLDSPYNLHATLKILYRVTMYVWLFPVSDYITGAGVLVTLGVFIWLVARVKQSRFVLLLGMWSIVGSTILFVAARPGISDFYLGYHVSTTDQFFYGQSLIIIFITGWAIAFATNRLHRCKSLVLALAVLFLATTIPVGSSFGANAKPYRAIGSAKHNINYACHHPNMQSVTIPIYPSSQWRWNIPQRIACD